MVKGVKSMWRQTAPLGRNLIQGLLQRIIMKVWNPLFHSLSIFLDLFLILGSPRDEKLTGNWGKTVFLSKAWVRFLHFEALKLNLFALCQDVGWGWSHHGVTILLTFSEHLTSNFLEKLLSETILPKFPVQGCSCFEVPNFSRIYPFTITILLHEFCKAF